MTEQKRDNGLWVEYRYSTHPLDPDGTRYFVGHCRGCRAEVTEGVSYGYDRECTHKPECPYKDRR